MQSSAFYICRYFFANTWIHQIQLLLENIKLTEDVIQYHYYHIGKYLHQHIVEMQAINKNYANTWIHQIQLLLENIKLTEDVIQYHYYHIGKYLHQHIVEMQAINKNYHEA